MMFMVLFIVGIILDCGPLYMLTCFLAILWTLFNLTEEVSE